MSVMRCSKCEALIDIDVEDYFFTGDMCISCYDKLIEALGKPKPSLIRFLKSLWRAIIDHAGSCKDEYSTRKGD